MAEELSNILNETREEFGELTGDLLLSELSEIVEDYPQVKMKTSDYIYIKILVLGKSEYPWLIEYYHNRLKYDLHKFTENKNDIILTFRGSIR